MSLGTGAKKGWWGVLRKYEAQQGGFHGDPVSGNQPCLRPPTGTVTLKKLQWKYLPNMGLISETDFQQGREGQSGKFARETL